MVVAQIITAPQITCCNDVEPRQLRKARIHQTWVIQNRVELLSFATFLFNPVKPSLSHPARFAALRPGQRRYSAR